MRIKGSVKYNHPKKQTFQGKMSASKIKKLNWLSPWGFPRRRVECRTRQRLHPLLIKLLKGNLGNRLPPWCVCGFFGCIQIWYVQVSTCRCYLYAVAWKAAKFTHGLCRRVQMSNEQELSTTITSDSHGKMFMHIVQVMQVASSTNLWKSSLDGHHAC